MATEYLIWDKRSFIGNAVLWWRDERAGYTTNFDEAGRYDKEEARRIVNMRGTDIAVPFEVAVKAVSRVVDADRLYAAIEQGGPALIGNINR